MTETEVPTQAEVPTQTVVPDESNLKHAVVQQLDAAHAVLNINGEFHTIARAELDADVSIGTIVPVYFDPEGQKPFMSLRMAQSLAIWETLAKAQTAGTDLDGEVVAMVKGGLAVDVGMRAFLPASQVGLRPIPNLSPYVGQKIKVRVTELDQRKGRLVVSRRVILEAERAVQRDELLKTLKVGDVVSGKVETFVNYGAFVDIGGVDGLLRNEDMSWGHVRNGNQVFKEGATIQAKVLDIDTAKGRVALGVKQLGSDPWIAVPEKYPVGTRVHARVLRLTEFGAFVEVEANIEALVHVSEMRWGKTLKKPSEIVQKGQAIEGVVLDLDLKERKMSLGMRQLTANPWKALREKHRPGDRVKGTVRSLTEFGAFITLDEVNIDGLLHASDMAWNERVKPSDRYKVGDAVEVSLLEVSVDNERISLGAKQLTEDPWVAAMRTLKVGEKVKGKVTSLAEFGAFVELAPDVAGLCHVTELSAERGKRPGDVVKVGDDIEVRILDIDAKSKRISLSALAERAPVQREPRERQDRPDRGPRNDRGDRPDRQQRQEKPQNTFKNSLADKLSGLKLKE